MRHSVSFRGALERPSCCTCGTRKGGEGILWGRRLFWGRGLFDRWHQQQQQNEKQDHHPHIITDRKKISPFWIDRSKISQQIFRSCFQIASKVEIRPVIYLFETMASEILPSTSLIPDDYQKWAESLVGRDWEIYWVDDEDNLNNMDEANDDDDDAATAAARFSCWCCISNSTS